MKGHTPDMVDLSSKKRAVYRFKTRLIISIITLLVFVTVIVILLVRCNIY